MKILTTLALTALIGCASPLLAEEITFTGFGGALQDTIRKTMLDTWTDGTVIEESYNGGIAKIKAMVGTNSVTWDVVQMDENEMLLACDEGLLEPMDWSTMPQADQIMEGAKSECGAGAFVWSLVSAYDTTKLPSLTGWDDFWNVEGIPGKRGLRKVARTTLEIALLADGVAPADIYTVLATPEGQDRAFAKLDQIKPYIQWWESGAQPIEWLASGDLVMTAAYNGRIVAAQKEGRAFNMVWDKQLYAMDFWAIPKGAKASAKSLVQHMMSDKAQAAFATEIVYGVTNSGAEISPELAAQLPTSEANMKNALAVSTTFWLDYEEQLQQRFNTWVAQ